MPAVAFALSIHHFISSVGADAGFAAIVGLAILVLLFFSQARETANLRRRAEEAEEMLDELRAYVDRLSRQRPAPSPTAARPPGVPVAPPPAVALAAMRPAARVVGAPAAEGPPQPWPFAPAGVGAPALGSATRAIPPAPGDPPAAPAQMVGDGAAQAASPAQASPAAAVAADVPGAAQGALAQAAAVQAAAAEGAAFRAAAVEGAASQTLADRAGAAPQARRDELPPPRASTAAAVAPDPPRRPGAPRPSVAAPAPDPVRRASPARAGARPAMAGRPAVAGRGRSGGGRGRRASSRRAPAALLAVAAVAVLAAGVVLLLHSGSTPAASRAAGTAASGGRPHRARGSRTAAGVNPAQVTVTVLNGTTVNHLAADVLHRLTAAGYRPGATDNAPDQAMTSTVVGYTRPAYRPDALAVARALRLGPSAVQAVSQGALSVACPAGAACAAQVVVSVGQNLAPIAG